MMRILLFIATLLYCCIAIAQSSVTTDQLRLNPTTMPTTCSAGAVRVDSANGNVARICHSNAWVTLQEYGGALVGNLTGNVTGNVTGNLTGNVTGAVTGNASTATALAANPTDCASNTYATAIDAGGNLTCGSISNASTTGVSTNTISSLVLRDGSGNFAAGTITAALTGNATTATALAADPADCSANTYATSINATGTLGCASITNAATTGVSTATGSTLVLRDGSGNFAATTITAALTGTASGNTTYTPNSHGVVLSGAANVMTVIAPDASVTKVLTSGGASADPVWAVVTATVPVNPRELLNVGLSNSVGSSALTLSLKQSDGSTAPAAGAGAVKVAFRSSTATSGTVNERSVSSALTFTVSSGTTLGLANSVAKNIWIYLIDSDGAGTMKLGASTFQLDEDSLQTAVAESFSATATNASPCVFTANAHGLINQNKIRITGTPPTGFSTGTDYFLVNKAANTFQLSATPAGAAINSSSTGSSIVIHVADSAFVSDAVYTSMPIRLIGKGVFTESTTGTWASAATTLTSGPGAIVPDAVTARYTNTGGETITTGGSDVKITSWTLDYDSHNALANDTYVFPGPGKYRVSFNYTYASGTWSAAQYAGAGIYKNGAAHSFGSKVAADTTTVTGLKGGMVAATINAVAGDYMHLTADNTKTASPTLSTTAGQVHFEVERIGL